MNPMYKEVVSIVPEEEAQDAPQASDMWTQSVFKDRKKSEEWEQQTEQIFPSHELKEEKHPGSLF